ncbi:hypothetical protein RFF05_01120 [Bengtsoniella intestinalis]|uniref:hypothetical protein n=1 Tax=Bengtsoniella intestinalis TaxID=3073143 RepID=UPI00391F3F2E
MLRKLMKYDLKSLFKLLLPVYLVGLLLAVVNGFFMLPAQLDAAIFDNTITSVLLDVFETLSLFSICSILLIANLWCVIRVYNSVFAKEGYLTNTLPVSHHTVIISKLLSCFIALAVSGLVVLLLLGIFSYGYLEFAFTFADVEIVVAEVLESLEGIQISAVVLFVVFMLVGTLAGMLQVLLSMAIGHLTRHPIILGIVVYFGIQYLLIQPVTSVVAFNLIESFSDFSISADGDVLWGIYYQTMGLILALNAIWGAIFYGGTAFILKRKLNLQ